SGKGLSCRTSQIVVQFRSPPHMIFDSGKHRVPEANRLVIHIQPAEGLQLHLQSKVPDAGMRLRMTDLAFRFCSEFPQAMPDAYERLLLDTLSGDASLFARSDEVELAWGIIDPILKTWDEQGVPDMAIYEPSQWGPVEAQKWIWRDQRDWLDVCPVLR
ncbi:MAG TPA: glucose-6-phosphate dehydrogenase, partial [Pirellulales bacterium]|nr:glucose-6-phosphate dehydrogenase [Pirellulales bacterium]